MHITYSDIKSRLYAMKYVPNSGNNISANIYTESGMYSSHNAIEAIHNWKNLAETTDEAFSKALDIFEEVCTNDNTTNIKNLCSYLLEGVNKVRDVNQLQNSIKYRNSRIKTKISTKINNKYDIVTNAIKDSIDKSNSSRMVNTNMPTGVSSTPKKDNSEDTEGVAEECFNLLLYEAAKCEECDRIVANYEKVSKRFNLDRIVTESMYPDDYYQAAWDIAKCMDTYNVSFKQKYCCALENAKYVFNKHYIRYPDDKILEAVTDYFIFTTGLTESNLQDIFKVAGSINYIDGDTFQNLNYLDKDITAIDDLENVDPETDAERLTESYGVDFNTITIDEAFNKKLAKDTTKKLADTTKDSAKKAAGIGKEFGGAVKKIIKDAKEGNPEEKEDAEAKKMIEDFRKSCTEDPDDKSKLSKFKNMINKLFARSPHQIANEIPNLFSILRAGFIIGATAINLPLGIVTLITDQIIKIGVSRKQADKIAAQYNKEIDRVEDKIEKAKGDNKDNLEKYLKKLKDDLNKIDIYRDELHTDDENTERHEKEYEEKKAKNKAAGKDEFDPDDFEFDWGDDDDDDFDDLDWDDIDLETANNIVTISDYIQSISECLVDDKDLDGVIFGNIFRLDNDTIDSITDLSTTVPAIIDKRKLANVLKDYRQELRESKTNIKDYMRIDMLNANIYKLEHSATPYNTTPDLQTTVYYLSCLDELAKLGKYDWYVVEGMSITNTIKLAIDRMKRGVRKLSDKEKQMSDTIDSAACQVSDSINRSMINDSKQSIISGSMLPSASKCIKAALVLGVSWAINPAIAVIEAIAGFVCKKKMKRKERQLVLDEIEIELKMVDRYIHQAEENNDMEKLREYEKTQRSLQRAQQRVKYSMHTHNDRIPDPHKTNND